LPNGWGRSEVRALVLIWLGWAALMLAYPLVVRARFELQRPDTSLEWTGANTTVDPHAGETAPLDRVLGPHVQWDSVYYLSIAHHWYEDLDSQALEPGSTVDDPHTDTKREHPDWVSLNYAYFPVYPIALRIVATPLQALGMDWKHAGVIAGITMSLAGALAAMFALFDLAGGNRDAGVEDGRRAAFYVLIWPASFFLAQVYTEGVFLGVSFGALAMMRRRRWVWAGVLGFVATWTRATGALLLVPFFWEWLTSGGLHALRRPTAKSLTVIAAVAAPAVAYLIWHTIFGARFTFVEGSYFGRGAFVFQQSWDAWVLTWRYMLGDQGAQASVYAILEFAGLGLGLASSLWLARRDKALALYGLALIAVAVTSGSSMGIFRYVLGVPALFLVPAQLGRHLAFDRVWTLANALALGVGVITFSFGFWAG
jgi:hypothetical protein